MGRHTLAIQMDIAIITNYCNLYYNMVYLYMALCIGWFTEHANQNFLPL